MKLVLIGYMGSGKSLIGNLLAAKLGYTFYDLDSCIAESYGATIPEIFNQKGEIFFRKLEAKVLREMLASGESCVLATGGGTPCYAQNLEAIHDTKNAISIYLHTKLPVLVQRLTKEKEQRPLIAHLPDTEALNDFIRKHLFDRSPFYEQAQFKLKTEALLPQDIVEQLVLELFQMD